MWKVVTSSLTVIAVLALMAAESQAKSWWARCPRTCAAPAPAACAPAPPAPQTTQAPGAQTYQSFSYEPGATVAPATPARMAAPTSTRSSGFDEPWRYGDSKATGRYLWNSR
jgi:hypothetical protein